MKSILTNLEAQKLLVKNIDCLEKLHMNHRNGFHKKMCDRIILIHTLWKLITSLNSTVQIATKDCPTCNDSVQKNQHYLEFPNFPLQ